MAEYFGRIEKVLLKMKQKSFNIQSWASFQQKFRMIKEFQTLFCIIQINYKKAFTLLTET